MGMLNRLCSAGSLGRTLSDVPLMKMPGPPLIQEDDSYVPRSEIQPCTHLPGEEGEPFYNFREIIKEVFFLQAGLQDELLPNLDMEPFMDVS